MSGRCKSCDAILEEWEMKAIDPLTGTYTELCDQCLSDPEVAFEFAEIDLDFIKQEDIL